MLDILLDANGDVMIDPVRENGLIVSDLVIGNIDYQRCEMIMQSQKGDFKEFPTLGFGIDNYLKGTDGLKDKQKFIAELTKELKSDGIDAKIVINESIGKFEITV